LVKFFSLIAKRGKDKNCGLKIAMRGITKRVVGG
jgi:hypothetical protein